MRFKGFNAGLWGSHGGRIAPISAAEKLGNNPANCVLLTDSKYTNRYDPPEPGVEALKTHFDTSLKHNLSPFLILFPLNY